MVVYRATDTVTGEFYIGCTTNGLAAREYQHRNAADNGSRLRLHSAIRELGHDRFRFEEVYNFDGDHDLALAYESEAIAKYAPAYNVAAGGRKKKAVEETPIEARRRTRKPVVCLTDGRTFDCARSAGVFYGLTPRHINNAARATEKGVYRTHHTLRFAYVEKA